MDRGDLLAWARGEFARADDPRDRDYYAGVIDTAVGTFDGSRCLHWRVPRDEPEYCVGGRDALRRMQPVAAVGRMRHGR